MNRFLIALTGVMLLSVLTGCVRPPDQRPEVVIRGERQLQLGVRAYNNNDYRTAATLFTKAIELYQSIDDREGIIRGYINLMETALAVGNFQSAEQHLQALYTINNEPEFSAYRKRVEMLKVKLDFAQGDYQEALASLLPLIPEFDPEGELKEKPDQSGINAIASRARIAFKQSTEEAVLWSGRYESAIKSVGGDLPYNLGLLNSFKAELARRNGDYKRTQELLNRALSEYKLAGLRRGVALTLKSLANLEMEREQWLDAESYLQRALKVSTWMLDRSTTAEILNDLALVNDKLGREQLSEEYRLWHQKCTKNSFDEWEMLRSGGVSEAP